MFANIVELCHVYLIPLYAKNLLLSQEMFEFCLIHQPSLTWNGTPQFPWGAGMTPCTFYGIR